MAPGDLKQLICEPAKLSAAWSKEFARRVQEIDDGKVEMLDWEDVRAELFAEEEAEASSGGTP